MKICLLVAYSGEVNYVTDYFHLDKSETFYFTKKWKSKDFDLFETGVGKVHAAVVTQLVVTKIKPDCIINVGVCGGFEKETKVGDVILPAQVTQFDIDTQIFGDPRGLIPGIKKVKLSLYQLHKLEKKYKKGLCITGDTIISDRESAQKIYQAFHPTVVDMELGAIAQVCYLNKTKLISIKVPTDIVEKTEILEFEKRLEKCMKNALVALEEVLQILRDPGINLG